MQSINASGPAVPDGFTGLCGRGLNPIGRTIRSYTFAVYRGWYAYGTGCLGDMGHYSLWQPYRILNLGVPEWVEGRPNKRSLGKRKNVSTGGRVSTVGLPKASSVRWRHPATALVPRSTRSGTNGGMKRRRQRKCTPTAKTSAAEGMLIIGDKGKILCDFRGKRTRLLPKSRQQAFAGSVTVPEFDATSVERRVGSTRSKTGKKSRGSFEEVAALAEAVTLANIALRVPYKRLLWMHSECSSRNSADHAFVHREQFARVGHAHRIINSGATEPASGPMVPRARTGCTSVTRATAPAHVTNDRGQWLRSATPPRSELIG